MSESTVQKHFGCFRCDDGLTPLYCLNCANALNHALAVVQIGEVTIARLENGQLWLTHRGGEGMTVTKEEKLSKLLDEFFRKEF